MYAFRQRLSQAGAAQRVHNFSFVELLLVRCQCLQAVSFRLSSQSTDHRHALIGAGLVMRSRPVSGKRKPPPGYKAETVGSRIS
jgi:hypothetical protein